MEKRGTFSNTFVLIFFRPDQSWNHYQNKWYQKKSRNWSRKCLVLVSRFSQLTFENSVTFYIFYIYPYLFKYCWFLMIIIIEILNLPKTDCKQYIISEFWCLFWSRSHTVPKTFPCQSKKINSEKILESVSEKFGTKKLLESALKEC